MKNLKPCPFCGGAANKELWTTALNPKWIVGCFNEACAMRPYTKLLTPGEAIKAWNTRHKKAEVVE